MSSTSAPPSAAPVVPVAAPSAQRPLGQVKVAEAPAAAAPSTPAAAKPAEPVAKTTSAAPQTITVNGRQMTAEQVAAAIAGMTEVNQTLAQVQKQTAAIEEFENLFKDPGALRKALKARGVDLKEFAGDSLLEEYEAEFQTPEEKATSARDRELEELRTEKQQRLEAAKEAEQKALITQIEQQITSKVISSLQAENLPPHEKYVARSAELMMLANDAGFEMTPEYAAAIVRSEYENEQQHRWSSVSEDNLDSLVPANVQALIIKRDQARLKAASEKAPDAASKVTPGVRRPKTEKPNNGAAAKGDWLSQVMGGDKPRR